MNNDLKEHRRHRELGKERARRRTLGHAFERGALFLLIKEKELHTVLGYADAETCIRHEGGYAHTQQNIFCLVAIHLTDEQAEALADALAETVAQIFMRLCTTRGERRLPCCPKNSALL